MPDYLTALGLTTTEAAEILAESRRAADDGEVQSGTIVQHANGLAVVARIGWNGRALSPLTIQVPARTKKKKAKNAR